MGLTEAIAEAAHYVAKVLAKASLVLSTTMRLRDRGILLSQMR